jgi:predicted CXXCH cytochrome family protein
MDELAHAKALQVVGDETTVILGDFAQGEDVRTVQFPGEEAPRPFTVEDVAFVVGAGRHAQRYVYAQEEGVYRVFPAEWNTVAQAWQPFTLAEDWMDAAYDWGQNCAACHTSGFNVEDKSWLDEGVQCEACHGPGSRHLEAADELSRNASAEEIDAVRATIILNPDAQICGQCHSRGVDASGVYPFPAGYVPGVNTLDEVGYLLAPLDDPVHWWSTGHAKTPNMQYNEWVNTGHATTLDDLKNSDYAQDACLECHSSDYDLRQKQIASYEAGEREGSPPQPLTLAEAQNGVACSSCHNPHVETEYGSFLVNEPYTLCVDCHRDTELTETPHHPAQEMYEGLTVFNGIKSIPSSHFTAENSLVCETCHMPDVPVESGSRVSHALSPVLPVGENSPPQDTCTICHTDLTPKYMKEFVDKTQDRIEGRLERVALALEQNPNAPDWVIDAVEFVETDGSLGVHNYAYTDALLDAVAFELGIVELNGGVPPEQAAVVDPVECEECHREEVRDWQNSPHANASLNDNFLREFAARNRPNFCMRCHASGYDAATNTHQFEGVICTSCHIVSDLANHPPDPVEIATDSAVCGQCHSGAHSPTYDEWLVSDHSLAGVDCVDCHTPHNNGLILGDVNATCGDCHKEALVDDIHMGEEMTCTDCHLKRRTTDDDVHVLTTGHTMAIDPGVCSECHGNTHLLSVRENNRLEEDVNQIKTLQQKLETLEDQAEQDRNTGIVGGALGAVLVVVILYLLLRFRTLF